MQVVTQTYNSAK